MTAILRLDEIKNLLRGVDPIRAIEEGFVAYAQKKVTVPPVGELLFDEPPGDMHIKYGCIKGDDHFVVKIATGFYENTKIGLPSGSGMMILFSARTGMPECILLDEGYLTNVRTAAAGAVAARYLAPGNVGTIGVFGAGIQGRMQIEYLKSVTGCRKLFAWGVNRQELDLYAKDMTAAGFEVETTMDAEAVASRCNLIVTATPSKKPLLLARWIRKGTHITAMGSDTSEKIELDPAILREADIVVADSIEQSRTRGEVFGAVQAGAIREAKVVELGDVIQDSALRRSSEEQITVADLTGVAVQDIQIAKAVYAASAAKESS